MQASFTSLSKTGKPLSKCGKCLRYIKYINARSVPFGDPAWPARVSASGSAN